MKKIIFSLIVICLIVSFTETASFFVLKQFSIKSDNVHLFTQKKGYSTRTPGTFSEASWGFVKGPYKYTVADEGYRVGIRNYSPLLAKRGIYRIITIGTSCTWGLSLENHETWPAYLEKELLTIKHDDPLSNFEVLNFGNAGSDTRFWLKYYQNELKKYNPNLVIIELGNNDMVGKLWERHNTENELAEFVSKNRQISFFPYGYTLLLINKLFINSLDKKKDKIKNETLKNYSKINRERNYLVPEMVKGEKSVEAFKQRIRKLVNIIRSFNSNTKICFLIWPMFTDLENEMAKELFAYHLTLFKVPTKAFILHAKSVENVLTELAGELNIENILIKNKLNETHYNDFTHTNSQGNEIIGNEIFKELRKRNLIPHSG